MTWIISKLKIQGVKGVLDRSGEFKLASKKDPRSLVIYAPNACGKSGYADAVEYLFSEDGEVEHLGKGGVDSEKGGKHAIPHVLAEERGIEPSVSITLLDTDSGETTEITRAVNVGRNDARPPSLDTVLKTAPAHCILRQHDLRRFVVEMTPGEKYSELARWIGITRLESVQKHLTTTSNLLAETNLDREITERREDIGKNTNNQVTDYDVSAVLNWCSKEAGKYFKEPIEMSSLESIDTAIEKLKQKRHELILESKAAEAYTTKLDLIERLSRFIASDGQLGKCKTSILETITAEQNALTLRDQTKGSIFNDVWKSTKDLLVQNRLGYCPVCQTPWADTTAGSQESVFLIIHANLKELESLVAAEDTHTISVQASNHALQNLETEWNTIISKLEKLEVKKFVSSTEHIGKKLNALKSAGPKAEYQQKFEILFQEMHDLIAISINPHVRRVIFKNTPNLADEIEGLVTRIENLKNAVQRLGELTREREEYRKIEAAFNAVADTIRGRSAELVNNIVTSFSEDVQSIYKSIHPSGAVPNIFIVPDPEDRILKLRIDFHNPGRTLPPSGYLSESYINTLGLALFISSVKLFNRSFPFLFLDDIVSSYDADHRGRIVDVIAEGLNGFQVILTTHDHRFYTMLRDRLSGQGWIFERIVGWELDHGPKRESDALQTHEIENLIRAGNPSIAGNAVRQCMEEWLDKVCAKCWVFTLHKRGLQEYDRTLFDFWGPFIDRLQNISGRFFVDRVESNIHYQRLKTHSLLNHYSHWRANPYEWAAIGDVQYVWAEFSAFQEILNCASCGKQLKYDHEAKRFYCLCGGNIFEKQGS